MKKKGSGLKWLIIAGASLAAALIFAVILVPNFMDIEKYKPAIEKKASQIMGRPVHIDGKLSFKIFPWVGVSFSNLYIDNPPGFTKRKFISVKDFKIKLRLKPLLSKDIQISDLIINNPVINLEKNKSGAANWDGIIKDKKKKEKKHKTEKAPGIKNFNLAKFVISGGELLWIDAQKGEKREIKDFELKMENVSFDKTIPVSFSAKIDGLPVSVNGKTGPLGITPGKAPFPVDLVIGIANELKIGAKGRVEPEKKGGDFEIKSWPFSPKKLAAAFGKPLITSDPGVLGNASFSAKVSAGSKNISVTDGKLKLDKSNFDFSFSGTNEKNPHIKFYARVDRINLDSYMPPEKAGHKKKKNKPAGKKAENNSLSSLKNLNLKGKIKAGSLKLANAEIQNFDLTISGEKGIFRFEPLTMSLYNGKAGGNIKLNARNNPVTARTRMNINNIMVGDLIRDVAKKDIIEGTGNASFNLSMSGLSSKEILSSLNGDGNIFLSSGKIKGINLGAMVKNIKMAFNFAGKETADKPVTEFTELKSDFIIKEGVVNIPGAKLISPVLKATCSGNVNLGARKLDLVITPSFAGTILDKKIVRSDITVPVIVDGTFSSPKFRPDVVGMIRQVPKETILNVMQHPEKGIKSIFGDENEGKKEKNKSKENNQNRNDNKPEKKTIGDFLNSFPFDRPKKK